MFTHLRATIDQPAGSTRSHCTTGIRHTPPKPASSWTTPLRRISRRGRACRAPAGRTAMEAVHSAAGRRHSVMGALAPTNSESLMGMRPETAAGLLYPRNQTAKMCLRLHAIFLFPSPFPNTLVWLLLTDSFRVLSGDPCCCGALCYNRYTIFIFHYTSRIPTRYT